MKTVIIGRGAVGSSVAYSLRSISDRVAFACDPPRAFRHSLALYFNGEKLENMLIVPGSDNKVEKADLVIVAVKNFQLSSALPVIAPFVGDDTVILPILNGVDAEDVLSGRFGEDKVIYGYIQGLSVVREGNRLTSFSRGRITLGEKGAATSERVERIAAFLNENGQLATVSDDIIHAKWVKFMTNTCFNTLSSILIADYGAIGQSDNIIRAARMMAREVQLVAANEGVALTQDDVETMIRNTVCLTGHGKSSMLEDMLSIRETENRYFAGTVSRKGRQYGIPTPYCDFSLVLVEAERDVRRTLES